MIFFAITNSPLALKFYLNSLNRKLSFGSYYLYEVEFYWCWSAKDAYKNFNFFLLEVNFFNGSVEITEWPIHDSN